MTETSSIDPALFREVMGHYPTGVVLVTGSHPDGEDVAAIMGTFTSVSLEPPLVAFLPMKSSSSFRRLQQCPSMCINILTGDQEAVGRMIASRKTNKFEDLAIYRSPSGDPILQGSLAWIDVRLRETIEAGDHWIAMCDVKDLQIDTPTGPLIFFQGGYGRFTVPSLIARLEEDLVGAVKCAQVARPELEGLANIFGCEASLITELNRDEFACVASAIPPGIAPEDCLGNRIPADFAERVGDAARVGYSLSFRSEDGGAAGPRELAPGQRYAIGSVVVPVLHDDGRLLHLVRLSQLPGEASDEDVRVWIGALRAAARRIGARLSAPGETRP